MAPDGLAWGDSVTLQQYGQQQYQKQNFDAALEAFTRALDMKLKDPIGILDNRAATYCKLKDFTAALKDGRQMVKTDKVDPRGYLRSAKVLQLMAKSDKALEMYEYALKTLPRDHPRRAQIEKMKTELARRIHGPPRRDPFDMFPLEIASMVLDRFNFKQLVAIMRVSKRWDRLISSFPRFWAHLDFSQATKKVRATAARSYIRRAQLHLTQVTLAHVFPNVVEQIVKIVVRCPLTYLDLRTDAPFIEDVSKLKSLRTLIFSESTAVSQPQLDHLLASCSLLERVEVHHFLKNHLGPRHARAAPPSKLPNIRTLRLRVQRGKNDTRMRNVQRPLPLRVYGLDDGTAAEKMPNIEELSLINEDWPEHSASLHLSALPRLRRLEAKGLNLLQVPQFPETLEYLSMCEVSTTAGQVESYEFEKPLRHLKTAVFNAVRMVTLSWLTKFFRDAQPRLETFHLTRCSEFDADDLRTMLMAQFLKSVSVLDVSWLMAMDDKLTPYIIEHMPNLRAIDMSYSNITGVSVKQLTQSTEPKLEKLIVKTCERLGTDAVQYARARGVKCAHLPMERMELEFRK